MTVTWNFSYSVESLFVPEIAFTYFKTVIIGFRNDFWFNQAIQGLEDMSFHCRKLVL
jgi:hypothetical protein